ncbi:radical SAM/SPASM domain-containing protein [Sulfurospirillum barnesii]|uniref:Radical SAM additional 4Fe4S-binding domain protein n=1 Tax=Sulfurospirillum barnesii (strain ATCC 700032 / DSM 10660 / SES-3) TaxID=760154 RepID=I3XXG6_SULBS|nr:radical SAM protein [Sulfurospirillum barnesii]AFL68640.1 radical SAM additional 4Fe4S-binding domain protein [Sulfurospirillum barnesii SES-3]
MSKNDYIPENCVWELTLKCNMNCLHCGSRAGKKRKNELSNKEALALADELINLGCKYVTLIGGEVFLYNGWEKIARRFTENGVTVNIITNGYHFGDKQVKEVTYAGLSNIALSIDGMKEKHNTIRNNSKSFDSLMKTINRLNQENIKIGVNTTLIDSNVSDLEELYTFLLDNNIKIWQLQLANPMGNFSDRKEQMISINNIKKVTSFIKQKRDEGKLKIYTGDNIGYYDENEKFIRGEPGNINYWSGCHAGLSVVGIDSVGNVKGCESLYDDIFIEGNIREESFSDIWFKDNNFAYNRKFDKSLLSGKCKDCDMGVYCRAGCRGACFFTNGNFFENAYCIYNK